MRTFSELFVGRDDCYGSYTLPAQSVPEGQKKAGRGRTMREPVTPQLYEDHLAGVASLGVVPIRTDNSVMWFAIDVDTYDNSDLHADLLRKVAANALPLVMTKSKSGGAHLWCFLTHPMKAKDARHVAKQYLQILGLPAVTEIFPKQDEVDEKNVGSWINLPYFGDTRIGVILDTEGQVFDMAHGVEQFVEEANDTAIDPTDLLHDAEEVHTVTDGSDAPPCIDVMEADGVPEGGRDNTLTHVAVYLKKKFPDDWQEQLMEWNVNHCSPPLPHADVMRIASSSEAGYYYLCKQSPMCNLCDKKACLSRKFGVGGGDTGEMPFVISSFRKINSEVPVFWIAIDDREEIRMRGEDLLNYNAFKQVVFNKLSMVLPIMSKVAWEKFLSSQMPKLETQQAPKIVGETGIIIDVLSEFLKRRAQSIGLDKALSGSPYVNNGEVFFRSFDFLTVLKKEYAHIKAENVWAALHQHADVTERTFGEGDDAYSLWVMPYIGEAKERNQSF